MHVVYLWHKGQRRHIYIVYHAVYQPESETQTNCVDSIPHSRHAQPSGVHAWRALVRTYAVVSRLAGRRRGSVPSARGEKSRERITDLYSLWILEGP